MDVTTGITVAEAVVIVNGVIRELAVGPERVTAVDPSTITVDWTDHPPGDRTSKMSFVADAIKRETWTYMHQMPQVLLVAEDGVVRGIFGFDTGTKVGA